MTNPYDPKKSYTMDEIRKQIQDAPKSGGFVVSDDYPSGPEPNWDLIGDMIKKASAKFAGKVEEEVRATISDEMLGVSANPNLLSAPLSEDDLNHFTETMLGKKETWSPQFKAPKLGPHAHTHTTYSPHLEDVVIMRQFSELATSMSTARLREIAEDAEYEIFEVDWLKNKYVQPPRFNSYSNKQFVVTKTRLGKYEYLKNRFEMAVFAEGYVVEAKPMSTATGSTKGVFPSASRGKRGQVGASLFDKMANSVAISKDISFEPEYKDSPMVLESTFLAKPIAAPQELIDDLNSRHMYAPDFCLTDVMLNQVTEDVDGNLHVDMTARKEQPIEHIEVTVKLLDEGVVNKNGRVYPESSIHPEQSES